MDRIVEVRGGPTFRHLLTPRQGQGTVTCTRLFLERAGGDIPVTSVGTLGLDDQLQCLLPDLQRGPRSPLLRAGIQPTAALTWRLL